MSPVSDKDDEEQGDEACESPLQNSETGDSLGGKEGHSESLGRPDNEHRWSCNFFIAFGIE